ncbi:NINJ1-like protein, partial [Mya arenaria]
MHVSKTVAHPKKAKVSLSNLFVAPASDIRSCFPCSFPSGVSWYLLRTDPCILNAITWTTPFLYASSMILKKTGFLSKKYSFLSVLVSSTKSSSCKRASFDSGKEYKVSRQQEKDTMPYFTQHFWYIRHRNVQLPNPHWRQCGSSVDGNCKSVFRYIQRGVANHHKRVCIARFGISDGSGYAFVSPLRFYNENFCVKWQKVIVYEKLYRMMLGRYVIRCIESEIEKCLVKYLYDMRNVSMAASSIREERKTPTFKMADEDGDGNDHTVFNYNTRKTIASGLFDVALVIANASQLKALVKAGPGYKFYYPNIFIVAGFLVKLASLEAEKEPGDGALLIRWNKGKTRLNNATM